ncbi:hypothetical protein [Rhodoplanes roseus]|uniref:Protease HtpX n=1 Tax=Rhodoplanes roseus TaxID=29409 RepID=A0A327KWG1_9BRAD|nr:hypothetical protein [Rhodoplanes roseus]RAI41562.1 hypothetical protein CH341_21400 [Rhodoplanes roseus]
MKALILYTVFVVIGAVISAVIGYYAEREISEAVGLVVFLSLFFLNFAVSWVAVILVIDRSLSNAYGRAEQIAIERQGRAAISGRAG